MTRVIHTGDTHLGYRQYHSPRRRRDFLEAFRRVARDAVEADVDAVVHAGDLFHDRRPGLTDLQGTVAVLRELRDAGVPFLAVVGNHEAKRDGQWLDLFEDLGLATRLGATPEVVGDTAFYGLDYVPRSRRGDLDYDFDPHDAGRAALVSHGLFEPFAHADWDTETVLESSSVDFDAVLLGDNHDAGTAEVCDAWVTYCGSTERASAAEREQRGYNVVHFDDEVSIRRRAVPDTRTFCFVDVDLAEGEGTERVRERVREHEVEDAVVVVTVTGAGEEVTLAAVEEFADERGALVARVNDRREAGVTPETDVSFADPDGAVRERVRDLGLSEAARGVDETVRASGVADSNVRETTEERVRDLLDEAGDLSAFETGEAGDDAGADGYEGGEDAGTASDESDDAGEVVDVGVDEDVDGVGDAVPDDGDERGADPVAGDDRDADAGGEVDEEDRDVAEDDDAGTVDADAGDADGQASMEEFL